MCRLLTWVARQPRTVDDVIGRDRMDAFRQLGGLHSDGWGVAWWPAATAKDGAAAPDPQLHRSPRSSVADPEFIRLSRGVSSDAGIMHLRWATPGLAVLPQNTHPFVRSGLAMGHNGGIYPLDRLTEILPPTWEASCLGSTDSERYFLAVVAGREETGAPVSEVLGAVVTRLFSEWQPSSLNAVLLTPDAVVVVSAFNPQVKVTAVPESTEEYYALRYRADDDAVVLASSGIDQSLTDGWERLDNMTIMEIRRHSLELRFTSLGVQAGPAPGPVGQRPR